MIIPPQNKFYKHRKKNLSPKQNESFKKIQDHLCEFGFFFLLKNKWKNKDV